MKLRARLATMTFALTAAALYDVGEREMALSALQDMKQSRHLAAMAWSGLVTGREASLFSGSVVTEARYRRVQLGWVE